jgi:hypothetical protein
VVHARRRLNAMGRLLRADWWFAGAAAAVDYTLGVPLPRGEAEEAEDVPQFEEPVLLLCAAPFSAESLAPVRRPQRVWPACRRAAPHALTRAAGGAAARRRARCLQRRRAASARRLR